MAAQPLSALDPNANYRFGTRTLENRPELALYIAQTISIGSIIERRWSSILIDLLQADPLTGMAMYQALTSTVAQRAALGAAAKVRLVPEDFELFQAVAKAITPARNIRNEFAHHLWGETPEVPDALLLIDPAAIQNEDLNLAQAHAVVKKTGKPVELETADRKLMKVYRKQDFLDAKGVVHQALLIVADLWAGLHFSEDELILFEMRTKLRAHPLVAAILHPPSRQSVRKARRLPQQ